MSATLTEDTLRWVHASALAPRCVLRGSLVTALWIPARRANDIDFLVDGEWTVASLTPVLRDLFAAMPDVRAEVITIWEETDFPGLRATLRRGPEAVQVDFGWGERLASPPALTEVRGLAWRAVSPEVMFGWKVHSLVEHGPRGRWHAKTLADVVLLLRHVKLDLRLAQRAIVLAFESQRLPLSRLDGLFDDPTWGRSRGSRNKWRSYQKKAPWVTFGLFEALDEARAALHPMLRENPQR